MTSTLFTNCAIATLDAAGTEHASGYVLVEGNRIAAVGEGSPPAHVQANSTIDGEGCLLTPGLVNTHHHLYQWATRGYAVDKNLFNWLVELYPTWGRIDEEIVGQSAGAALGWLALTGCTTSTDHHYVFPRDSGDLLGAEIAAAKRVGLRFHPTRGSMDLGESQGGLPPDHIVEDRDTILAASEEAIAKHHDPSFDSMVRIGIAPCSPFSVTGDLMHESAGLARKHGVRLHTHLTETVEEDDFCREKFGCSPVDYVESLGWLADDVWLAHGVHLTDDEVRRLAATGTGVAHCPTSNARLGAGIAPAQALLAAGGPVGLGVDGAASNEESSLITEAHMALCVARLRGGPEAMTARQALSMATIGGARCLGREAEIGSIEVGKLADLTLWRLDLLDHVGIGDPVAALIFGSRPPLEISMVNGEVVVDCDRLVKVSMSELAHGAGLASARLREAVS